MNRLNSHDMSGIAAIIIVFSFISGLLWAFNAEGKQKLWSIPMFVLSLAYSIPYIWAAFVWCWS